MALQPPNSRRNGYPLGLTGATAPTRYVGGTTSGPPSSGTFAVGDYVIAADGGIWVCTTAGSPGSWLPSGMASNRLQLLSPAAAGSLESVPRLMVGSTKTMVSGSLYLQAIYLPRGYTVSSLSFYSGATALVAGTNQLFGLYSSARALLATSADDTSTAWGSNTVKTLAMTVPYLTTTPGIFYTGIMVAAGTPPTIQAIAASSTLNAVATIVAGVSSTGLTTALPDPAAAITASGVTPWCLVA